MSHLAPFLAIVVITMLVSERGFAAARSAVGGVIVAARGVVDFLRTLGRRYARLTFGS